MLAQRLSQTRKKEEMDFEALREQDRLSKQKKEKKKAVRAKMLFKDKFMAITITLCVFGMALLLCILEAKIGICGYSIIETKAEISDVQTRTERLELEIADLSSLTRVEEYARVNLGMIFPDVSKVAYIDYVPMATAASEDEIISEIEITEEEPPTTGGKVLNGLYKLFGSHFSGQAEAAID